MANLCFLFFFFYLHTPDTVHTLWPWFTIFHCNVFQHESVMLNVAWFSGGPAVLQITLVCVTFKIWLFSYLKVNWFRCLIKDQIRLGGDLPPKRPHGCWDEKYVNIFFIFYFFPPSSYIRLQRPDCTHFVFNLCGTQWGVTVYKCSRYSIIA